MRPVLIVKMLLDIKLSIKCVTFFHFEGMDVCRTTVRSNTFPDCV